MDLGNPDTRDKGIIYKLTEIFQATDNEKMYTKVGNKRKYLRDTWKLNLQNYLIQECG